MGGEGTEGGAVLEALEWVTTKGVRALRATLRERALEEPLRALRFLDFGI
jgi:hypothetical protein